MNGWSVSRIGASKTTWNCIWPNPATRWKPGWRTGDRRLGPLHPEARRLPSPQFLKSPPLSWFEYAETESLPWTTRRFLWSHFLRRLMRRRRRSRSRNVRGSLAGPHAHRGAAAVGASGRAVPRRLPQPGIAGAVAPADAGCHGAAGVFRARSDQETMGKSERRSGVSWKREACRCGAWNRS